MPPHHLAVLAFDGVLPFDLATAVETFARARLDDGTPPYRITVAASHAEVAAEGYGLRVPQGLASVGDAATVIVPGMAEPRSPADPAILAALARARHRGARIASICTGAFVLAAAGLLDGRRATTHWQAAGLLTRMYPKVAVDPAVLYVDEGDVLTSAGAAAGLDLCLHMIRRDFGARVAARTARAAVVPLERAGGQAQFIQDDPPAAAGLAPLLDWMRANLDQRLEVERLAARAGMSPRTFARRFRAETGTTPLQWLLTARIRRAQLLLETTGRSIERVATEAGFDSAVTFRQRFRQVAGVTPSDWRRSFGTSRSG
ncbi:helix-turn-helix domain-containing protein [Tistrella mobilis]|uniref:GlxA family transcriptional regulator n=1 Tax=Tistrella mobilis TaxID=171437 RepID=UPI0031F71FAE